MKDHKFLKDYAVKDEITGIYLVKYIAVMSGRDGREYLNMVLSDSSGDLECRVWQKAKEFSELISKGSYCQVIGKINSFQGRKQGVITHIQTVDVASLGSEFCESRYIAKSQYPVDHMFDELLSIVHNQVDDLNIQQLLLAVLHDQEIVRRLKTWQAGKSIHHAFQGGLLEHILSCTRLAVSLSKHYQVNSNYVIAGMILHDLAKIYELTDGVDVEYTEEGKLVGHLVKGLEVMDRFIYGIKDFPHGIKIHLKHILLSHHGEYSFGSPKVPMTSEAMLVHLIDLMDSKMATFDTIKKKDNQAGHWSGYIKHLDRMVFKKPLPRSGDPRPTSDLRGEQKIMGKVKGNEELKQNLGNLLQDFKVK